MRFHLKSNICYCLGSKGLLHDGEMCRWNGMEALIAASIRGDNGTSTAIFILSKNKLKMEY